MSGQHGTNLSHLVALLASGVVAVPLFRRLGLGSVLGYLCAGLLIGPFGLGIFTDSTAILHIAELGVVLFLFVVGLEMRPAHLWSLRGQIFGLGTAQVVGAGLLLTGVGLAFGLTFWASFVGAMGFVLSSTAMVMQIMEERGYQATPEGQRAISTLLLEDLAIVPLLVLVTLASPVPHGEAPSRWITVGIAVGAVLVLLLGRFWLNPLFRLLAEAKAREVMTGAALLVVLGSALLMQVSGLSMAMGAFFAGVLLSESTFRHQLEADVEPFRGLLLGLFFLAVGMALDLSVFAAHFSLIVGLVVAFCLVKLAAVYGVARLFRLSPRESLYRGVVFVQGGEFAFVLFGAAVEAQVLSPEQSAILTATVIVSMALTPLGVRALEFLPEPQESLDGVEAAEDLHGSVLIIGFGRFGQVVSQAFLARDLDVTIIDTDTAMIRDAPRFGFKIYYGDGARLDVLRASGAAEARAIAVCIDDRQAANHVVELVHAEFPQAKLLVRAYDRAHALELMRLGVDYLIRETFESAMAFAGASLVELGFSEEEARVTMEDLRKRDQERLALQSVGGLRAGVDLMRGNLPPVPTPLIEPRGEARALNEEAAQVAGVPLEPAR